MPIKLVAIDIDGTLLNGRGELPRENAAAIADVVQQGIKLILVTGRRWGMARKVSTLLRLPYPLIVHNGALIKQPYDAGTLASWFLDPAVAECIIREAERFLPYMVLHRDEPPNGQMVVHPACLENPTLTGYLNQLPDCVYSTSRPIEHVDSHLIQIMFGGSMEVIEKIEADLYECGLLKGVKVAKTLYPHRDLGILDLLHPCCSKGAALDFLATDYAIERNEILAIGDNHNDLEMLEYAGSAIVVENCVEILKGRGFINTSSNEACGVAKALREFVLIQ
jgi:5-amino-6-(5-phospho-D-ribitylamino)uracil phosphatase